MKRRELGKTAVASVLELAIGALAIPAQAAETYPVKPIRMVVAYGAGGSLDAIARPLAIELGRLLGQSVVVENAPGASGLIGVRRVRSAAPDGYTLLLGITSEVALAPSTLKAADHRTTDFVAVGKVGTSGIVLLARPGLKVSSLKELSQLARQKPGTLTYGVPGTGSFQHIAMESLKRQAGIDVRLIPYASAAQVTTDLIGGHLDLAMVGLPALLPMIKDGKVTPLAVMSRERDGAGDTIAAARETPGLETIDFDLWTGLFAPKNTPATIVRRLNEALAQALASPTMVSAYQKIGFKTASPESPESFAAYVQDQESKLRKSVTDSGIKPE